MDDNSEKLTLADLQPLLHITTGYSWEKVVRAQKNLTLPMKLILSSLPRI